MAFRSLSTLQKPTGQAWRDGRTQSGDALISTVNGNIYDGVLINVSESQVGSNDKFLGLES